MSGSDPEASSSGPESSTVIVVGYSTAAEGRAALNRAVTEAQLRSSRLLVVQTSDDVQPAELQAQLVASGVSFEVRDAADALDPAEELLAAAESSAAEFIVIGLRRRSPVGKLLLGSNAQRILLDAACPVLAVKAEAS
jgi:nucleotide-binding universal stress UspA family protein